MHAMTRAFLFGAAILLAMTQTGRAQYVIPNVNTGAKSNVPDITPPLTRNVPLVLPTPDPTQPAKIDQRCLQLTDQQRRETPGCH